MSLRLRTLSIAAALLVGAGWSLASAEDLTIVTRVTPPKGKPSTTTQYITADKIRTGDGNGDTIVDVTSGQLTFIDHKKKTYYQTSLQEMRAHFAQFEEMLQSNPILEKMLGGAKEVSVEKTSETREIAGYACTKYVLSMGEKFVFEIWATSALKPPIQYYDARKMAYATVGPLAGRFEKMFDEMKKIDGFSLATVVDTKIMGMNLHSESEATEVKKGPVPASAFEPPAGYKQKKSPFAK